MEFDVFVSNYDFDVSQAAMGIAHLIVMAMEKDGTPRQEALKKIWMVDSKGLIVKVVIFFFYCYIIAKILVAYLYLTFNMVNNDKYNQISK